MSLALFTEHKITERQADTLRAHIQNVVRAELTYAALIVASREDTRAVERARLKLRRYINKLEE